MCQNFKTSEFDDLFNVNSIKTCFAGAGYKEINNNIVVATKYNKNLKMVIRCLDYNALMQNEDWSRYTEYPDYLYDDNIFNDVKYLWDKDITKKSWNLLKSIISGQTNPWAQDAFDKYSYWGGSYVFAKGAVLNSYKRAQKQENQGGLTEEERQAVKNTINHNVTDTIKANPNVEFYIFFSPYSIVYWDSLFCAGKIEKQIEAEKLAIEELLKCSNIHLFSFNNWFDMVSNLNNYKDAGHYSPAVNSALLGYFKSGEYQLNSDNYLNYINEVKDYYLNYNYDQIFE